MNYLSRARKYFILSLIFFALFVILIGLFLYMIWRTTPCNDTLFPAMCIYMGPTNLEIAIGYTSFFAGLFSLLLSVFFLIFGIILKRKNKAL